jgi:hypothetical protein
MSKDRRSLAFYLIIGLVLVFGTAAHAKERSHAFEARGLADTALIAKWCETPASKGHPPTGRVLRWCCHQYIGVKSPYSLADKCSRLWKRENNLFDMDLSK